ncbi:MAG: J domain-containing protein [Candidatus Caldarchaeum sp.]|nr:J domain-containing protein [Candidatus Caldarchaeum sp.]MCX8201617.1 J domain-containing protein [Candidatus Caldarchaeum sp.]MDW8063205.1 J domain-containing protein [Candidatus Caldarchaeum sp.]
MNPTIIATITLTGLTAFLILYSLKSVISEDKKQGKWPYSVLGVKPSDSLEDVKKAYREMVKRFHPDRLPHTATPQVRKLYEERLIQLNNAYKTILSLHQVEEVRLSIEPRFFDTVETAIEKADAAARSGEKASTVIGYLYEAAENLVKILHAYSGFVGRSTHFYDLLTDLMIGDVLTVEEFETLAELRRLSLQGSGEISSEQAASLVKRVSDVYHKIRHRYSKDGNG